MKAIPVEQAVGTVLCHDITRIVPGKEKGPAYRRGHVVRDEDVPELLDIGKVHLYVYDPADGYVHEDDAALAIASAAGGNGIILEGPSEGKVTFTAADDGLVRINKDALLALNQLGEISFATIHECQFVKKGRALAGTRVIPLVVEQALVDSALKICQKKGPVITMEKLKSARVGIVTTGSEVYSGRIKDGFGPVLRRKFAELGSEVIDQKLVSDEVEMTVAAIREVIAQGADMVAVTGGMSVDPDDQTPTAIRETGAEIISYGAPIFPGAMFLLAYLGGIPIVGLPGCVMYHRASIFDLIVPRILSGERIVQQDISILGHGGYCENCEPCRYPVCGFGKS